MTDRLLVDDLSAAPVVKRRVSPARIRGYVIQAFVILVLAGFAGYLAHNVIENIARLNIRTGLNFLFRPAGFQISQHLIPYQAQGSTYLEAFLVALVNTVVVTLAAIVLTTPLGFAIGFARLSSNRLLALVSRCYIDFVRNVPFLLQLFFWYFTVLGTLPLPRNSLGLFGTVFANRRGLNVPSPEQQPGFLIFAAALGIGLVLYYMLGRLARRHPRIEVIPVWLRIVIALVPAVLAWAIFGAPLTFELPELQGFNFQGGMTLHPEFVAMVLALATYNAAFIAELVRGGILSVPRGQIEAGLSLGLKRRPINFRIVLPLALRVIVPPLGSQYAQLLKSSSLGAAIAYPDIMLVFTGTTMTQTNQPIEIMLITMATYLFLCLLITGATNLVNKRVQLVER
jgi:general L-amino acid transport system permease protein